MTLITEYSEIFLNKGGKKAAFSLLIVEFYLLISVNAAHKDKQQKIMSRSYTNRSPS